MRSFRIRIMISESFFNDIIITADGWYQAESIGRAQSPIGKAYCLGESL